MPSAHWGEYGLNLNLKPDKDHARRESEFSGQGQDTRVKRDAVLNVFGK